MRFLKQKMIAIPFIIFILFLGISNTIDKEKTTNINESFTQKNGRNACGIYLLDSKAGTINNNGYSLRDANLRDFSYINGYTLRLNWSTVEISKGEYDFSQIDNIIQKLEEINKSLSLILINIEPKYLFQNQSINTWEYTDINPNHPGELLRIPPWNPYLIERYDRYTEALSTHLVYSKESGEKLPLNKHPRLASINSAIPGLGLLRSIGFEIQTIEGYNRDKFIESVIKYNDIIESKFKETELFIGLWQMDDGDFSVKLSEDIRLKLLNEFDGVKKNKIGFFMDNLAASKNSPNSNEITGYPSISFGQPLYDSKNQTHIGFQALQSWKNPFRNENKTINAKPKDAIKYAIDIYGARYVELYLSDLISEGYNEDLDFWNNELCNNDSQE